MSEMEDKIGAILNNPQMMQQIMSMAQAFGSQQSQEPPRRDPSPGIPDLDLSLVQTLSGFAQKSGIDQRERALLGALQAYLSVERVKKLEKAMRAAKIAQLASSVLGQGGLSLSTGR